MRDTASAPNYPDEDGAPSGAGLRRVLTFWPLVLYGMGVIVGAGIYVALAAVMARAMRRLWRSGAGLGAGEGEFLILHLVRL